MLTDAQIQGIAWGFGIAAADRLRQRIEVWPNSLDMLYPFIPGEPLDLRIIRIVRDMAGCSLSNNKDKLAALVEAAGPPGCVNWHTNCGTFALGVLRAACGELADAAKVHPLLAKPIGPGQAISYLYQIGNTLKAWKHGEPTPGSLIWYELDGTNDDHVEFYLSPPDEHGGGGRTDNAITVGHGDIHESWHRPIHAWLDWTCLPVTWLPTVDTDIQGPLAT